MPLADARKVDLGYCSTSHAAQGATVDRVIVNIDSQRTPELVNNRQFYVSLSRPRTEARIYTDSTEGLRRAVSRKHDKELALDIAHSPPSLATTRRRIIRRAHAGVARGGFVADGGPPFPFPTNSKPKPPSVLPL
jgi:Viral (Superfamily 1) RNA helicase